MIKPTDLAKPAGITLSDHTQHVVEEAQYLLKSLSFICDKYQKITNSDLSNDLLDAAKYHDWGKAAPIWQRACRYDYQLYRQWRKENGLDPDEINAGQHRRFESDMRSQGKISSPKIFKAGLRHEFASLKMVKDYGIELPPHIKTAIAAHHGKLSFRYLERWKNDGSKSQDEKGPFYKYWGEFKRLSSHGKKLDLKALLYQRYQFAAVRSLLRLADTRASRKEGEGVDADYKFLPFEFNFKYKPRPVQQAVLDIADKPMSILRAPTGSGKTFASLLWAREQINAKRADRLVVAMPTRFTSNALSISVAEEMGETGLYHSSAWHNKFGDIKDIKYKKDAKEAIRMAKYLATPVTVCTIDHLMISLTGVKEDHQATFFFLANSCVVFDEADFYDPFVQANLVVLLDVLRLLEVPVLIMSATVPDSARELYKIEVPIKVPDETTQQNSKMIKWLEPEGVENEEWVMQKMLSEGNGIIYANTVERALWYYDWFTQQDSDVPLVMYHSRYTEPDKKRIEERLINMLGKSAWENSVNEPVRGIAIMTQIGEMSVNISSALMLSDLCPWDRLAQRIGRLVRFEHQKVGICYVVEPRKKGHLYPAPYGEYDTSKNIWIAKDALYNTKNDLELGYLEAKEITSVELVNFVNELYSAVPEMDSKTKYNQANFRELIIENWLIQPAMESDEEDVTVADRWSSRHIPPQISILTYGRDAGDELFFSDFNSYQNHILEFGVSCPMYLIKKEMRKGETARLEKATVKLEKREETLSVYRTVHYDSIMGLSFLYRPNTKPDARAQVNL